MDATVTLYCVCQQEYDLSRFMIECEACKDWFHGSCVGVEEHQASEIEVYHCPDCAKIHGPIVVKKRNWLERLPPLKEKKGIQTGTGQFVKELKGRTFPSADQFVKHMSGYQITRKYLEESGFDYPIIVEKKEGLELRIPPSTISMEEIEQLVGPLREIDVIDVERQEDFKLLIHEWVEYFKSPNRQRILNVISLEFSTTRLSELVEPPSIVRELSWVDTVWGHEPLPEDCPYARPAVQKYCLMGVKDSFTDFHVDFGGTSVWYHVLRGEKIFYLIKPTQTNLHLYENWVSSANQSSLFFGDQVDSCYKCVLKHGQTLLIPTGWIHAVLTPIDSLVFGGNFLHSLNIPLQLQIYEMEKRVNTPEQFLFPVFETSCWYAARHTLELLKEFNEEKRKPPTYLFLGAKALAQHLKSWTMRKDYFKSHKAEIPETVHCGKLLKELNKEVKRLEKPVVTMKTRTPAQRRKRKKKDVDTEEVVAPPVVPPLSREEELKIKAEVYDFKEEDDEQMPLTPLKVRIPRPDATATKDAKLSTTMTTMTMAAADDALTLSRVKPQLKLKEDDEQMPLTPLKVRIPRPDAMATKDVKPSTTMTMAAADDALTLSRVKPQLKLKLSHGRVVSGSAGRGGKRAAAAGTTKAEKEEPEKKEGEEGDEAELVVDDTPPKKAARRPEEAGGSSAVKPGSLKLKLSLNSVNGGAGKDASSAAADAVVKPEATTTTTTGRRDDDALDPSLSGSQEFDVGADPHLGTPGGASIADILRASGYGEDEYRQPASPSTRDAIQGMLSIATMGASPPLMIAERPKRQRKPKYIYSDDTGENMATVFKDSEFIYPALNLSDTEEEQQRTPKVASKPKPPKFVGRNSRDDTWNPKVKMGGNLVPKVRPHREGVRIPAVESALADAAEKLSHLPPPKRMYQRRKMAPKPPPPDPLVTPGTSVEAPPSEKSSGPTKPISKKPKKGQATTKQRLGRILKIHKMVYLK